MPKTEKGERVGGLGALENRRLIEGIKPHFMEYLELRSAYNRHSLPFPVQLWIGN